MTKDINAALGNIAAPTDKSTGNWLAKMLFRHRAPSVQNATPDNSGPETRRRLFKWTSVHSFYAIMGGYTLDTLHDPRRLPLAGGITRLTLTPKALVMLAEHEPDLLPDMNEEAIKDKSKANHLAKFLVCIQAAWFSVQVIERLAVGLAISILELNTFAHCICTLAVYTIWWDKPLDIEEPTVIPAVDDYTAPICAAMYLASSVGCLIPCRLYLSRDCVWTPQVVGLPFTRVKTLGALEYQQPKEVQDETVDAGINQVNTETEHEQPKQQAAEESTITLEFSQSYRGFKFIKSGFYYFSYYHVLLQNSPVAEFVKRVTVDITPEYQVLMHEATRTPIAQQILREGGGSRNPLFRGEAGEWVTVRARNWPFAIISKGRNTLYVVIFLCISAAYGGWHLLAWNGPFRTRTELMLWRISGLGVASSGILAAITGYSVDRADKLNWVLRAEPFKSPWDYLEHFYKSSVLAKLAMILAALVLGLVLTISVSSFALLLFSRTYLVIEAFLSLPYASNSVFAVPNLNQYFPHIN